MKIFSKDFNNNEKIPKRFTCEGEDTNPTLILEDVPKDAKSLVLIMYDPDAPNGTFVHWILYNIPIVNQIDENFSLGNEGINSASQKNYIGPCPPSGEHRYIFQIYALDCLIEVDSYNKTILEEKIKNHILDKVKIIGLYSKENFKNL